MIITPAFGKSVLLFDMHCLVVHTYNLLDSQV